MKNRFDRPGVGDLMESYALDSFVAIAEDEKQPIRGFAKARNDYWGKKGWEFMNEYEEIVPDGWRLTIWFKKA